MRADSIAAMLPALRLIRDAAKRMADATIPAPQVLQRARIVCHWRFSGCLGDALGVLQEGTPGAETIEGTCLECLGKLPPKPSHSIDSDCFVDAATDCCRACHVHHGEPCPVCGKRAFHDPGCREAEE